MSDRADFYVREDGKLLWIGSLFKNGRPSSKLLEICIQLHQSLFEEMVFELIKIEGGVDRTNGEPWPWPWEDSQNTEYSYIFDDRKVYLSIMGGRLLDPIKIIQGMDTLGADVGLGKPDLPKMDRHTQKIEV
jgi:hypothetical protein